MATERRRQTAGGLDEIRRQRRARRLQEKRRRAALRRRNALLCVAIASAVIGATVGSGAGGGAGSASTKAVAARPSAGGVGPPRRDQKLVTWDGPVPILMYHVIANPPATAAFPELFVDPKTFDAQMAWLAREGYAAVSLNQVYNAWFKGAKLPQKPVVLTFDDGYRGDFVYARRTLRRLRWPGDLNLLVKNLGGELTDPMVQQLIKDGWEIDAHTISHLDLTAMSGPELQREVAGSRRILQSRFHQPVNFFCYPAGKFDAQTIQAVRAAGYLGATTELPGDASKVNMFELHRIRVDGSDGVAGLATKLRQARGA